MAKATVPALAVLMTTSTIMDQVFHSNTRINPKAASLLILGLLLQSMLTKTKIHRCKIRCIYC